MRVAGGAIARKIIPDIKIRAALVQMGPHQINRNNWDWDLVNKNPFFSLILKLLLLGRSTFKKSEKMVTRPVLSSKLSQKMYRVVSRANLRKA